MIKTKATGIFSILKMAKEEPKENITTVGGMLDQFGIFELCQPTPLQPPTFALRIKNKPLAFLKEVEDKNHGQKYKPIKKVPWALPVEPQAYESEARLFEEIRSCVYDHIDLPKDDDYTVLAAWIMATWLQEKWTSYPFLNLFGAMEAGKSRTSEILGKLSFRGWNATFVSAASLYRVCDLWHPVLLLDETEAMLRQQEIVGLLNASYRKGSTVPRQQQNEDGTFDTEFYELHGFRVLAGTRELPQTLKSRSIVFHMRKATRKVRLFIDEPRCLMLRNQLLQYRFTKMLDGEGHEGDCSKGGRLEDIASQLGSGRLAEIFHCLIEVAPTEEIRSKIMDYAKNIDAERQEELASSDEGQTLTAILHCSKQGKMTGNLILIKDITDQININLSYAEQWSYRKTGSLCSRLGFKKANNRQKLTCIKWDAKLIEALKQDKRYTACFAAETADPADPNAPKEPANPQQTQATESPQAPPTPVNTPSSPSSPLDPLYLQKAEQLQLEACTK